MKSFDDVYNDAVDYGIEGVVPADAPVGVVKLSQVLRVSNALMSGGLGFAIEVIEPVEFQYAVEGFRYLGLNEIADLLSNLVESSQNPDYDERGEARLEELLNEGDFVLDSYRRKVAVVPADFGF
jgi:hypothetical protein